MIIRSLAHYWRTNLAVVAGVAVAVTVLAGALLVGDSVRGSLRDLMLGRLGRTDLVVVSTDFFRAQLAGDIAGDDAFAAGLENAAPLIALPGFASSQDTSRRASGVLVYGIDERFQRFHQSSMPALDAGESSRDLLLSPALARELGADAGSTVLLRVQRPTDIPLESLHGRKEDVGRTIRLVVRGTLDAASLGEFSLQPQQGEVRAAFVPLARLQRELGIGDRVNAILVAKRDASGDAEARLTDIVGRRATLEDFGLRLRALDGPNMLSLESASAILDDRQVSLAEEAARHVRMEPRPVLTYLANTIRSGSAEVPYSLVTATDLATVAPALPLSAGDRPPIVLNDWAARQLTAKAGDTLTLDYYVWEEPGRLATRTSEFRVAGTVPIAGAAADRDLAPEYPGITGTESLRDWDPPFPLDLSRIRDVDEQYWTDYRTTPKAFVPLAAGQAIWRSRYGAVTSVRIRPPAGTSLAAAREAYAARLRDTVEPATFGVAVRDVRTEGLAASRGATDFGEYFTYFSFFLVVSALLLASLFFKLGVEQRVREIGLLRAVGFTTARVRRQFLAEGLILAVFGSALGMAGAVGYAALMMAGLRTWWVDAVGTTALTLHVTPASLASGAAGGIVAALLCIWWTLRALSRISERALLAGELNTAFDEPEGAGRPRRRTLVAGVMFALFAAALLGASFAGVLDRTPGFFGGGITLLAAWLCLTAYRLRRPPTALVAGTGALPLWRLGMRNTRHRPARTILAIAVIAAAAFIVVAVDAFRRDAHGDATDRQSGTGGYPLLVDTLLPLAHDPNSPEGRELLGLDDQNVAVTPFRVLPGDDASCLNLYAPQQPRILGATAAFLNEERFAFGATMGAAADNNPWQLLNAPAADGAVPVAGDANSLAYVLHKRVGDVVEFDYNGRPIRLRIVAALVDSIFQGELLMSEAHFRTLFPEHEGYRFLLVEAPPDRVEAISSAIEGRLADFGGDARLTSDRLAEFHRVENTYLSTFQTLGGLGLLLGTLGLAAVLLRNVLERRRELALLAAVGYSHGHVRLIVIAETAWILVCGLGAGAVCALVAILPAALERGGRVPAGATAWLLLFAVFAAGLVSAVIAARAAVRTQLVEALRAE